MCLGLSFDHDQGYMQFVYHTETNINMAYIGHIFVYIAYIHHNI